MKNFYKIENGELHLGVGTKIPSGFIEYSKGKEPEELLEALKTQKQRVELQNKINEALQYLASTAWYVERLNDPSSGKAIPEEVLTKRAEARELINTLEAEIKGGN